MTNGFDLDHNLDLWVLKVKRDLDLWPHTWPWPWIFMVKFWNSCISEWEGWLTLHKGGGSRSFMTMIMTIWWPRSGVWIYQIVTVVTSVVSVRSAHLVAGIDLSHQCVVDTCNLLNVMSYIGKSTSYYWTSVVIVEFLYCEFNHYLTPVSTTDLYVFSCQWTKCDLRAWFRIVQCPTLSMSDLLNISSDFRNYMLEIYSEVIISS